MTRDKLGKKQKQTLLRACVWVTCASFIAVILCCCSGRRDDPGVTQPVPQVSDSNDQAKLIEQLSAELDRELARIAEQKQSTAEASRAQQEFTDIDPWRTDSLEAQWVGDPDGAGPALPLGLRLRWVGALCGDCDQNGLVNVSDITPLAQYWQQTVDYVEVERDGETVLLPAGDPEGDGALNWRLSRVDGNHDGVINISDVTEIAQNWGRSLAGYNLWQLYASAEPHDNYIATVFRHDHLPSESGKPVVYTHTIDLSGEMQHSVYIPDDVETVHDFVNGDYYLYGFKHNLDHNKRRRNSNIATVNYIKPFDLSMVEMPVPVLNIIDWAPRQGLRRCSMAVLTTSNILRTAHHWNRSALVTSTAGDEESQWVKELSGLAVTRLTSLAADTNGNTYLTGGTSSNDKLVWYYTDHFLIKLNSNGDIDWQINIAFEPWNDADFCVRYMPYCAFIDDQLRGFPS